MQPVLNYNGNFAGNTVYDPDGVNMYICGAMWATSGNNNYNPFMAQVTKSTGVVNWSNYQKISYDYRHTETSRVSMSLQKLTGNLYLLF